MALTKSKARTQETEQMQHANRAMEIDTGRPACHDPVRSARSLMRRAEVCVLGTLSCAQSGHPFGSLVPYVLTVDRRPAVRLSAMAHPNLDIRSDARISLTVTDGAHDRGLDCAWVTMLGEASAIPDHRAREVAERYFDRFPRQPHRECAHHFYWIEPSRIRYGGQRGESFWIESEEWFALAPH
jgi:hypothetical protein